MILKANAAYSVVADIGITFIEAGVTSSNTRGIYKVYQTMQSYIPGRQVNQIEEFESGIGYYIVTGRVDLDLTGVIRNGQRVNISLISGGAPLFTTDETDAPTQSMIYIAARGEGQTGDLFFDNLKLADGSAAPSITVTAEEADPEGGYDRVELRYSADANEWTKEAIKKGSAPIVDNLESSSSEYALSANQGRVLDEKTDILKDISRTGPSEPAFEFTDAEGNQVAIIDQEGKTILLNLEVRNASITENFEANTLRASEDAEAERDVNAGRDIKAGGTVIGSTLETKGGGVVDAASVGEYIISQEDGDGNIAWGITNEANDEGKRILRGVTLDEQTYSGIQSSEIAYDIYTTSNDISAWSETLRGNSLNVYLERAIYLGTKYYLKFRGSDGLTKNIASRRYNHPEPQNGSPRDQPNYLQNVITQNVSDVIVGDGFNIRPRTVNLSHISTRASRASGKLIRKMCLGDSVTNGAEAQVNKSVAAHPSQYWAWEKYNHELDRIAAGNTGYGCIMLGSRTVATTFPVTSGSTTNNVRACGEGYSGWNTRDMLYAKTFDNGNRFYDADKEGQVKFSLVKYLKRYRTMSDDGVRLANDSADKGTEVTDTAAYDVCTPNVFHIQFGFNDAQANYLGDMRTLIQTIKTEFPDMVIALSVIGAAGSWYPEKWDGWDGASRDISFFEPFDLTNGFGYSKRLNDKMWALIANAKSLENKGDDIFFVPNFLVQPTAQSVPYRVQGEPFGKVAYQPYANSSYAYHPNNLAHRIWGYHNYSFTKYLSSENLI